MKRNKACLSLLALPFLLSGCDNVLLPDFKSQPLADFTQGKSELFEHSDGWTNGGVFDVFWKDRGVSYTEEGAELTISEPTEAEAQQIANAEAGSHYIGSEVRSKDHYHYGYYGTTMKACKQDGVATTFFTYTGPSEDNPWDEIDIEFLGKDTTKVQFNYFTDGHGGHEYLYDLGFDASEEFHQYGFYWGEDIIVWYVDNEPVYHVTGDDLPSTPGKIMMNFWSGNEDGEGWMGKFAGPNENTVGYYKNVTYADVDGNPFVPEKEEPEPEPEPEKVPDHNLEYVDVNLNFQDASGIYQVTNNADDSGATITYQNVGGSKYATIKTSLNDALKEGYSSYKSTIKNTGEEEIEVRVDVLQNVEEDGKTTEKCINTLAGADGLVIPTDLVYGGSKTTIAPGDEKVIEVFYEGNPDSIAYFFDSSRNTTETYSGSVEISNYQFGYPEGHKPEGDPNPEPVDPFADVEFEDTPLTFAQDEGGLYTVTNNADNTEADVSYSAVTTGSYATVKAAVPEDKKENHAYFRAVVENTGENDIQGRLDILGEGDAHLNQRATKNATEIRTDLEWGGSFFSLTSGEKATITVEYSGIPVNIGFMFDSFLTSGGPFAGQVKISNYQFGIGENSGEVPTPDPEPDPDPEPQSEWQFYPASQVQSNSEITYDENGVLINYENVSGSCYGPYSATIPDASKSSLSFTLENRGENDVRVRADALAQGGSDNIATSATIDGNAVETFVRPYEWPAGPSFTIAPDQTVTLVLNYPENEAYTINLFLDTSRGDDMTYSGSVYLSNFVISESTTEVPDTPVQEEYKFTTLADSGYQVTNTNGKTDVTFTDVVGNSYVNINMAYPSASLTSTSLKITNTSAETITIRADVVAEGGSDNIATSATVDGEPVTTFVRPYEWPAGPTFIIAPNQTVTLVLNYPENEAAMLNLFINSSMNDATTSSGSLTITEVTVQ